LPEEGPPHALFQEPDWPETLVQLYSFSKVFALTGYRVGALLAGPTLMAEVAKAMDCVAICAPRIGQAAALFGLAHLEAWRQDKRRLILSRVNALQEAFRRKELAYALISAGAYFAYVRHPFLDAPAADVARYLAAEHNLLCLPGSMFGPDQEAYLRFAFANIEAERMPEIVQRLVDSQG
jgi:aspartate/methionine/tyrosine aminotransferase